MQIASSLSESVIMLERLRDHLRSELARVQKALKLLRPVAGGGRGKGKRVISAEGRRRISIAQKKRWATKLRLEKKAA